MKGAPAHGMFEVLRDWGVDLVFTCPGSTEAAFLDASLQHPDVRVVLTTHESVAVAAADGYARATGRPAVAYLHANVGLANGIAHLHCARLARSPLVVLNGMKSTAIANRGGFTTATHPRDYVRQHVVFDRIALRSDGILDDLTRALAAATGEPGGPVYLGLPQDLVEADVAVEAPKASRRRVVSRRRPAAETVADAAALLAGARGVVLVAGSDIARHGAEDALLALAEKLDAPVLLEDRRTIERNGVRCDHPRFAGIYAPDHPAVAAADVVFFAGMPSPMEFEAPRGPVVPAGARVIHQCADPVEIAKVTPVDVAIAGDSAYALRDILDALPSTPDGTARAKHRADAVAAYRAQLDGARAAARARMSEQPIATTALMQALHEALPSDAIVVGDPVTSGADLLALLLPDSRRAYYTSSGGSLGWGFSAALGVALASPGQRVVSIVGDGVFQFGVHTLWTAAALGVPLTVVVIDNSSYAAVRAAMKRYRGSQSGPFPASDLSGFDVVTAARGFGAWATSVERLADLGAALDAASAQHGPAVINVRTDPSNTGP